MQNSKMFIVDKRKHFPFLPRKPFRQSSRYKSIGSNLKALMSFFFFLITVDPEIILVKVFCHFFKDSVFFLLFAKMASSM